MHVTVLIYVTGLPNSVNIATAVNMSKTSLHKY